MKSRSSTGALDESILYVAFIESETKNRLNISTLQLKSYSRGFKTALYEGENLLWS